MYTKTTPRHIPEDRVYDSRKSPYIQCFQNGVPRELSYSVTTKMYYNNVGEKRNAYRSLVGKPEGKNPHLEDVGRDRRIVLKCIPK
jgi:hypothetical protein